MCLKELAFVSQLKAATRPVPYFIHNDVKDYIIINQLNINLKIGFHLKVIKKKTHPPGT